MTDDQRATRRRAILAGAAVGLTILLVCACLWWRRPPQMGADREVFTAVDALFTAVTARDAKLLARCEQTLRSHRGAGRLPADAAAHLDEIIETARSGRWQPAAERLYTFMRAQRREGATDMPAAKKGTAVAR